jgi:hypothetical protein
MFLPCVNTPIIRCFERIRHIISEDYSSGGSSVAVTSAQKNSIVSQKFMQFTIGK